MLCVLIGLEMAALGIQSEPKPSEDQSKITGCPKSSVTQVELVKENNCLPVSTNIPYKEGRGIVCHAAFPLALGCTIKRARQVSRELFDDVQDEVSISSMGCPACYGTCGFPVHLNCNAPLFNIDEDKWRTGWGMLSCWNHASIISKDVAIQQLAIHIVDHDALLDVKDRTRLANISRACVSREDTAGFDDTTLAFLGYVNQRYNNANNFDVSDSWCVGTGCPNGLVSEEPAQRHPECVYDAKTNNVNTANGHIGSETGLVMSIPSLNDPMSACVLPNTSPVLSVGGRHRMGYTFMRLAGTRLCWNTLLGKVVPLSVQNTVPYVEDDPMWVNETAVLNSVGLTNDEGTFRFQVEYSPYDRLTAAAATRAHYDELAWIAVAGYDATHREDDPDDDDVYVYNPIAWHTDDEFEELEPEVPILE